MFLKITVNNLLKLGYDDFSFDDFYVYVVVYMYML